VTRIDTVSRAFLPAADAVTSTAYSPAASDASGRSISKRFPDGYYFPS